MPSKRSTNETNRQTRKNKKGSSQDISSRYEAPESLEFISEDPQVGAVKNDLCGVVLAVIALTMFISLISTTEAPVTYAIGQVLTLGFGAGAMLVPLALFLFALTFFMVSEKPLSNRVALGLTLIVLAILSLLSISIEGAEGCPESVFWPRNLPFAGGYAGGSLAWVLLSLVGKTVGIVVLCGLIVAGIVICGFTISGFVEKIYGKAQERRQQRIDARAVEKGFLEEDGLDDDYPFAQPEVEPATTFLGSRKTSVLKREGISAASAEKTTLLGMEAAGFDQEEAPFETEEESSLKTRIMSRVSKKSEGEKTESKAKAEVEPPLDNTEKKPATQVKKTKKKDKSQDEAETIAESRQTQIDLAPAKPIRPGEDTEGIKLPPLSMLKSNPHSSQAASSKQELQETGQRLQSCLAEFGLTSKVVGYSTGPLVTTFKIQMGEGERVNKITNLQDDIQLSLASESVRIYAPIPGTSLVGIEIPNQTRQNVCLGDVLPYAQGGPLEFAVGRDSEGQPVVANLSKMPHLLIAGTTGSGKSVMINSIIMSILMRATPEQVRLILVDPKRVEFSCYNGLPHLYVPVVTEPRQAASALQWAVTEMERRLKVFQKAEARDIRVYNKMCVSGKLSEMEHPPTPMPYLVVVIDELSDLMMVAGKDVEASIVRIAQLARAAGIHLIVATQRPSADVVTGLIKSNIDSRIALKVSSSIDSRVILDSVGAERLLGYGDMLFRYRGNQTKRILACYTSDGEIESCVDFIREQGEPEYHNEILSAVVPTRPGASTGAVDEDPLMWDAARVIVESNVGSTSGLQRSLRVGYARAGSIMDMLEARGVVGPPNGSKPRDVLLDKEGLEQLRAAEDEFKEVE